MKRLYQSSTIKIFVSVLVLCITLGSDFEIVRATSPAVTVDVAGIIGFARGVLIAVALLIGLGLVIINGYKFMTSQGDPRKAQDSKEGLSSAIIGIIFVLLATFFLYFILGGFLGSP